MTQSESFHLQSNLSSVLYNVIITHYQSLQKDNPNKENLPAFVSEALHLIAQDVSKIVNVNTYDKNLWENIELNSRLVKEILQKSIPTTRKPAND